MMPEAIAFASKASAFNANAGAFDANVIAKFRLRGKPLISHFLNRYKGNYVQHYVNCLDRRIKFFPAKDSCARDEVDRVRDERNCLQGVHDHGLDKACYVRHKRNYTSVQFNWRPKYCNRGGLGPCIVLRAQRREAGGNGCRRLRMDKNPACTESADPL